MDPCARALRPHGPARPTALSFVSFMGRHNSFLAQMPLIGGLKALIRREPCHTCINCANLLSIAQRTRDLLAWLSSRARSDDYFFGRQGALGFNLMLSQILARNNADMRTHDELF